MKRSRDHRNCPSWRRPDLRFLILTLIVAAIASAIVGLVVYYGNRGGGF